MRKILFLPLIFITILSGQELADNSFVFNPTKDNSFPYGYYIPENLEDAYMELKRSMSPEYLEVFKETELPKVLEIEQLRLGLWMREYWGLHSGSRLKLFFNEKGMQNPDNMTGAILEGFWNYLNGNKNDFGKWIIRDIEYQQKYERWIKSKRQKSKQTPPGKQTADKDSQTKKLPKEGVVPGKKETRKTPTDTLKNATVSPDTLSNDQRHFRVPYVPGAKKADSVQTEHDPLRFREP